MAWYALYNWFYPFRKTPYTNWIVWYKNYLVDIWFKELSKEEQDRVLERIELKKKKHEKELRETIEMFKHLSYLYGIKY